MAMLCCRWPHCQRGLGWWLCPSRREKARYSSPRWLASTCSPAAIIEREALIRRRVTRLVACDVTQPCPIVGAAQHYDIVMSNFCAESATDDRDQWLSDAGIENNGEPYVLGDTNLNGVVDAGDLNNLALSWQAAANVAWGDGDFNGDDAVNAQDLNDMALNWQHGVQAAAAVPEPAAWTLVLMALAVLLGRRRL